MAFFTSGQLRQIKGGFGTDAVAGGVITSEHQDYLMKKPSIYFLKHEPAGKFMAEIEKVPTLLDESRIAIYKSAHALVDTAKESSKQMQDATGKVRDGTEKLGSAIDKLMKVAGRPDFAAVVKSTESLVDSLERLAALEEKGLLDKVMKAMSK